WTPQSQVLKLSLPIYLTGSTTSVLLKSGRYCAFMRKTVHFRGTLDINYPLRKKPIQKHTFFH
ncbi:hypothetical protein, partial [Vibrio vulnificus]|uniref:hypothetical protein n=1 Tax=Vibrio vulnificus TaxID=672 RepID=UPI001EE6A2A9